MRKLLTALTGVAFAAMSACTDQANPAGPSAPRAGSAPHAGRAIVDRGNGLVLSVTYPAYVYGGVLTTWAVQVQSGTPPYTFYWDATACPGPDGQNYVSFQETRRTVTSVFEIDAMSCNSSYNVNLYVEDAAGRATAWGRGYALGASYYPGGIDNCGIYNTYPCWMQ